MIFNSFTVANDYNFGAQWPNGRGRRFFLPTNKTFEGVCLALAGKFLQRRCEFFLYLKSFCKRDYNLVSSQLNIATQYLSLICICKEKTFSPVLSINSSQKDKALPVKTSKPKFDTFFVYFGNSLLD